MRPTREGRVAPWRPGLVYRGIGIDPGTDTEDPEPPPNWASAALNGQAYIPYLPPPDPGEAEDLNLAFGTDSDGGGNRPVVNPTYANDGNLSTLAGRSSYYNGGGTDTWWLEADLGTAYDVDDLVIVGGWGNAGENDPVWNIEHSPDSATWTTAVGSYVWDNTAKTATLTLTSTETKRYWRIGQSVAPGFVYPLKVYTWEINGQTGGTDPTNIIWTDAPLSNDEDDATYEDVLADAIADEMWRVTLADTYFISSVEAILGFDNAGSVTVVLEAGNEADYSDAVVIATMTDTATGSFTADTLTASFTPTAVYQYWQLRLTTTAQDLRVYEVSLFGPVEPTGVHGDLTGREDADQHPASAVTFTPYSTIAATDVQAAIEELLDEGGGPLNNFGATTAPTANDDAGDGYSVGSIWINVTGDDAYICVDATTTAAVWNPFEAAAGGWATVSSGGTHTTSGGYEYYAFTSSGTLTISGAGILEALVVGGGGGGGGVWSGGGGGGAAVITQTIYLTAAAHTVTVGAGGIAGTAGAGSAPDYTGPGGLGGFSRIADLWAPGGSGGRGATSTSATSNIPMPITASGGGGATRAANVGTAATSGLGFAGGAARTGTTAGTGAGGGGGGASAVGTDAGASDTGGAGGAGETVSAFSNFGASGVFAGGGGGGGVSAGGNGGTGGGGHGGGTSANTGQTSPTANTGSGGGGGGNTSTTAAAGTAGATGVVVVRVPT